MRDPSKPTPDKVPIARGFGERAPTAGLQPRLADLFTAARDDGRLDRAITDATGAADTLLLASGTACLLTIFHHLRSNSDRRKVIVPAYTCPLVVMAALEAGLDVVACDVSPTRFDLDPQHLERLLDSNTLCIVPTHYGGWLTDVESLRLEIRQRDPEIVVIEDAAQAFGARWNGRPVGLDGDVGLYSFAAGKGLTTFEGGAIVSASKLFVEALRETSATLIKPSPTSEAMMSLMLAAYHLMYRPLGLRLAYGSPKRYWLARGDDIAAAGDRFSGPIANHPLGLWRQSVGANAMARLDAHVAKARATSDRITTAIASLAPELDVHIAHRSANPSSTFLFVTLPSTTATEDNIVRLWRSRLGISKLFTRAIGDYPDLSGKLLPSDTPNARDLAARTIILSTSGDWSGHEIETVVQAIRSAAG